MTVYLAFVLFNQRFLESVDEDSDFSVTRETGEDGTITVSNVTEGYYEFVEVSAPAGFDCDRSPVGVHVNAEDLQGEQTITVTKMNHHKRSLTITKRNTETGEPVPNTSFHVRGVNIGYENDVVTGADGKVTLTDMPSGCYEIIETDVPKPYILDTNNRKTVWIDAEKDQDVVVDFVNSTRPGLRLLKIDQQTGEPLSGVQFRVREVNGSYNELHFTDQNGMIVLENMNPGAYTIQEVKPKNGWVADDTVHTIYLEENKTTTIELSNLRKPDLFIKKVDSVTGSPIEGVKFQIWRGSDDTKSGEYPKTETQLREIQDKLYQHSKEAHDAGKRPAFKGLIEIMSAEATIVTAIHNIKSNRGSETPGVDFKTMRKDYLQRSHSWVIRDIQAAFRHFEPQKIRRKYIDKPGKPEKRPLGIPTIRDRIVQECMRIVLEPIFEAQFFAHSYGFRPMRSAAMALERVNYLTHHTGYHWIVEGDISKCFDHIDHSILLKRLYHMGIKDRRVLQIIKAILKAGVMGECEVNEEGTPQGGLISPLLANVYLDIMDEWISQQWECKRTRYQYAQQQKRLFSLRKTSLIPGFLVRYADDFVIITDTRVNAESWKKRLQTFLQGKMKLTLSQEKTLVTDIRRKYIKFLGYEFKNVPGKGRKGYIVRTIPDRDRLKRKVDKIAEDIKRIPRNYSREQMIDAINRINSQIRGVIQYYQCCTWVNVAMKRYSKRLQLIAKRRLKQYRGKWIPANQTQNLPRIHQQYRKRIPSIKYRDIYVGFTALTFCRWERTFSKNQAETPYSEEGRQLYFKHTKKKRTHSRLDELYSEKTAQIIVHGKWNKFNNFEFIMNRAYALNRDKLKCRVCGGWLISGTPYAHRINPNLPLNKVNRVNNLVSLHKKCFHAVNDLSQDISQFDVKAQKKIIGYREKLVPSHTRNK